MSRRGTVEDRLVEHRLNATAASLLGFLHDGPMTGWDLVARAEQSIGNFWSLTQSQVYRELSAMAKSGLIEAGERGTRDRQPFTITDAGRDAFRNWVAEEPGRETIRFPLLLRLMFGEHVPPDRLAAFIEHHEGIHRERLAGYQALRASIPASYIDANPFSISTLDFGIRYEEAVTEWFTALPETIRGKHSGTTPASGENTPESSNAW